MPLAALRHLPAPTQRSAAWAKLPPSSGIGEVGVDFRRAVVGAELHVGDDRIGVDHLVRVHPVVRVPDPLHLAERADQLLAVHLRQQLGPLLAVAVLARERAAVLDHEVGRLVEEATPGPQPAGAAQVEVDPAVDAAVAEVPVERRPVAVLVEQRAEAAQVVAEPLRRHRGVLPAGPVVALARHVGGRAQAGLADLPEALLFGDVVEQLHLRRGRVAAQRLHALFGACVALLARVGAELDQQPALAVGQQRRLALVLPLLHHVVDQPAVDPLEADRAVAEDLRHVVGRFEDVRVAEHQQRAGGGRVDEAHRRLQHGRQGALRADQGAGDVEALLGQQLVEVVAGDAARDVGVALADQLGVAVAQVAHRRVDLAAPAAGGDDPLELLLARSARPASARRRR